VGDDATREEEAAMKQRRLGGIEVAAVGLGCMSMTPIYGEPSEAEAIATLHRAAELGVNLIDTSDAYANGKNEELIGRGIKGKRDKFVLATKFGQIRRPDGGGEVSGRPDYVREACAASLKRLGVDCIDLYYIHRIDGTVPIEDTVGAMARLKAEGKIRHLGISECAPATLRRAHKTHPMAALQTEYSLWTRDAEAELLATCAELGVGYVAYAPLGRGFLTGTVNDATMSDKDRRREHPRFFKENMDKNTRLLPTLQELAAAERCTPAQLAIAWLLSRKPFVVPLPGTSKRRWLEENAKAADLTPSRETLAALDRAFPPGVTSGPRYPEAQLKRLGI
jgi:aryl-alcohol dehydrogenase-like predicted oxidoreductase